MPHSLRLVTRFSCLPSHHNRIPAWSSRSGRNWRKTELVMHGFSKGTWGSFKLFPSFPDISKAKHQFWCVVALESSWVLESVSSGLESCLPLTARWYSATHCFHIFKVRMIFICCCCLFFWPPGHLPSSFPRIPTPILSFWSVPIAFDFALWVCRVQIVFI